MKWIKLSTDLFTDEAILRLSTQPKGDTFVLLWIRLLIAAGKQDNDGFFKAYNNAMLAALLGMPLGTVKRGMDLLEEYGLINRDETGVTIANWGKHQATTEDREAARLRKQKQRDNERDIRQCHTNVTQMSQQGHSDVTLVEKDIDLKEKLTLTGELKEKRDEHAFPTTQKQTIFVPPTVDEVAAYCRENRLNVNAGRFVNYYASIRWMVGKHEMEDWRAAVRYWASNDVKPKKGTSYDIDEIDAMIMGA